MNHGSLFSGIGGFDLGAEWMGWDNVFHCECDSFCQKVLGYYWPKAILYGDIRETDFTIWRGRVDILTGGFPCQPYSAAGKRKGKEDDRHLWPEMLRAIREIRPAWVVGENVFGIVNWSGGLVFEEVCADLEAEGYEVQPYVLPACGVDAPHRRDRVWFIGYSECRRSQASKQMSSGKKARNRVFKKADKSSPDTRLFGQKISKEQTAGVEQCGEGTAPDTGGERLEREATNSDMGGKQRFMFSNIENRIHWQDFPTQPPICSRDDGLPGKLDGITFPKWRNESIKAYGNAIVPQIALMIFKSIETLRT